MTDRVVASRTPIPVDVEAGKSYCRCICGRSSKQPFCDGSHKGTEFVPLRYDAQKTEKVWFCGCKQTGKAPVCDGAHKKLPA